MNNNELKESPWDGLHEECGVFGMYDLTEMMWLPVFITVCLHYSTEDRRAVVLQ